MQMVIGIVVSSLMAEAARTHISISAALMRVRFARSLWGIIVDVIL